MKQPQKLLLVNHQSPGDILMLTAAVRDLHKAHPFKFITDVYTSVSEIWENNPYITKLNWTVKNDRVVSSEKGMRIIKCNYPLVNDSNKTPHHFIHGFIKYLEHKLKLEIPITKFSGDIHLSEEEKSWMSQVEEDPHRYKGKFWLIVSGGKSDFSAKWWSPYKYQQVVDHFIGNVQFVQVGQKHELKLNQKTKGLRHWHPPLQGVINLVGKTSIRQLIRLMYHTSGVICPVTFLMHLAEAVESKHGLLHRPCIVVAGGREPSSWEAYPNHQYIHTCGMLPCNREGGCWVSRCQPVYDGDSKDQKRCPFPIMVDQDLVIPKCMNMITEWDVINKVKWYLESQSE
jgi:ADP-heptose:LPS heptosyltransferase